ncbi:hypothetical protein M406DRAFT_346438 [Cryphonectria parasitica EP155]|uniref:F-box domain-containing protein n=1 Tax=Cryphonectria parasitica (strain ATCC 38755 / EP155) TaxID=660469 RepID=A0A9P4Y0H4_CRYP1|nr:uncharacterized protein M406DRAFT_346438 [Cryphonectria parasitica EP155]KAF3764142.1 hypothetical protein M406DRAFT_346438 [Cryphonectria parasitica EP155]
MARRPSKGSRAKGAGSSPTPIASAHKSTHASDAEPGPNDGINSLDIASLTLDVPLKPVVHSRKKIPPFRFMDLPSELRVKIYEHYFDDINGVIDLQPGNYFEIHRKLRILRVCRTVYHEASHVFYGTKTFRIFPIDGRHVKTKKGLLACIKPQCRSKMTTLELRLGPGWARPYRSWVVNDMLGLQDCVNVRCLHVYIEIDPSDNIFNGWRKSPGYYEKFCRDLLNDILGGLPNVNKVQFDAHSPVKKSGDMTQGLLETARANGCTICWGPVRGWTDGDDDEDDVPEQLWPTSDVVA